MIVDQTDIGKAETTNPVIGAIQVATRRIPCRILDDDIARPHTCHAILHRDGRRYAVMNRTQKPIKTTDILTHPDTSLVPIEQVMFRHPRCASISSEDALRMVMWWKLDKPYDARLEVMARRLKAISDDPRVLGVFVNCKQTLDAWYRDPEQAERVYARTVERYKQKQTLLDTRR